MITPFTSYSGDGTHGTLSTVGSMLVSYNGLRISYIGFDKVEYHADGRIKSVGGKVAVYNLNNEIVRIGSDLVTYKNGRIASIGYKDVSY